MKTTKILINYLITTGALLGLTTFFNPPTTHAAGTYHALAVKRVNQVPIHWSGENVSAYLWNYHLNHKIQRVSALGNITLYANKVLKMTNGKKTGIFYYVTNDKGTVKGYVWRGYMVKGELDPGTMPNTGGIPNADSDELENVEGLKVGSDRYNEEVAYNQDASISNQFKAGIGNNIMHIGAQLHRIDPTNAKLGTAPYSHFKFISNSTKPTAEQRHELVTGKLSFYKFVKADLEKQGINLDQYQHWYIGADSTPIYKAASKTKYYPTFGDYTIALLSPQYKSEIEKASGPQN